MKILCLLSAYVLCALPDIIITSDNKIIGPSLDMVGTDMPQAYGLKKVWEGVTREDYTYFLGKVALELESSTLYEIACFLMSVSDITPSSRLAHECVSLRMTKLLSFGYVNRVEELWNLSTQFAEPVFEIKRVRLYQLLYANKIEEAKAFVIAQLDQYKAGRSEPNKDFWARAKTILELLLMTSEEAKNSFNVTSTIAACVRQDPLQEVRNFIITMDLRDIKQLDPLTVKLILHLDAFNKDLLLAIPKQFFWLLYKDTKWHGFHRDVKLQVVEHLAKTGALPSKELMFVYETSLVYGVEVNADALQDKARVQTLMQEKGPVLRAFLYQVVARDGKITPTLLDLLMRALNARGLLRVCAKELVSMTSYMLPKKEFKDFASMRMILLQLAETTDKSGMEEWLQFMQDRLDPWCAVPFYILNSGKKDVELAKLFNAWYHSNTSHEFMEKLLLAIAVIKPGITKHLTCPYVHSKPSTEVVDTNAVLPWVEASGRVGNILGAVLMKDTKYHAFSVVRAVSRVYQKWAASLALEYVLKPWNTLKH